MKHFRDLIQRLRARFADQRTYYWILLAVLLVPNLFLCYTEPIVWPGKIALLLVPCALWMALLTVGRRPGAPFWFTLPLLVLGAFQLVLLYLFGNSIIAVDMFLNVATTNSGEALELLGKLEPAIIGVLLLYVPALVLATLSLRLPDRLSAAFRRRSLIRAGVIGLTGLVAMAGARLQDREYRAKLDIWPLNIGYNMGLAVERWQKSERYAHTSADFTFSATSERPDSIREVYILVIGETSRALNWQLYGYPRETTPRLMQQEGVIHFRDMLTQANATHKSVPIMLCSASAENYGTLYTHKSILTAFREAGFRTAFLSNQSENHSFIDFFGREADTTLFLKAAAEARGETCNPYDDVLLQSVRPLLADTSLQKLFLVLHTYGSHFDYQERYPSDSAYFLPATYTAVHRNERSVLLNAYDNSIRATDRLLSDLISGLRALPNTASGLLYASDHGEDLYDDDRSLFLHASPRPTYYQLHIPCILWFSPTYDARWPGSRLSAESNRDKPMTTNVIFHTLLSMGGIETPQRNDSLAVTSPRFTVTPRHYLNDHNKPRTLDRAGLEEEDIEMFHRMGLDFPGNRDEHLSEIN